MPDRVMRQFGYPQFIPQPLIPPVLVQRPPQPSLYRCSYRAGDSFENFMNVRCNFHFQTVRAHYGTEALPAYQDWFRQRTHKQVTRQDSFTRREQYRPTDISPTVVWFLNIQHMNHVCISSIKYLLRVFLICREYNGLGQDLHALLSQEDGI